MDNLKHCPFCGGESCIQEHIFHGLSTKGKLLYDVVIEALEGLPVYNVCLDTLMSEPLGRER